MVSASVATQRFIDSVRGGAGTRAPIDHDIDWEAVLDDLGDGPYSGDLFLSICEWADKIPGASRLASELLAGLTDVGAAQETVGALCAIAPPPTLTPACFESLRKVAADRTRHSGARAAALRGVLYLAQSERSRLRYLEGDLLALDLRDDPDFLRHAAAVLGLICAHRPDADFVVMLHSLREIPEATDEAAYALGMIELAGALGESRRDQAIRNFSSAKRWFEASVASEQFRPDARLFVAVIGVILAFSNGETPSKIRDDMPALREALFQYVASATHRDERPSDQSWIGQKAVEASYWGDVALAISRLADSFDRDAWLHPIAVIEAQLYFIVSASRTLFRRTPTGGFEAAIFPRIENHFIAEKTKLSILDQWLAERGGEKAGEEIRRLRDGIQDRLEALARRNPTDAASAASALAAVDSCGAISNSDKVVAHALIEAADRDFKLESTDPIVNELLLGMIEGLSKNEDFQKHRNGATLFTTILRTTLKFVINRDNTQCTKATAYLFDLSNPGPTEALLHEDYMNALRLSDLARICVLEPQDVGTGRADVQFLYQGHTIVCECKRTFEKGSNRETVLKFGAQAIAYQRSSVTFSAMLVLDLFDRAGRVEHIRDRATIEFVTLDGTEYALAVFRLQGRLKTPSLLRIPRQPC